MRQNIPVFDMSKHLKLNREEILDAVNRVIDSNILIRGREVSAFENEFAEYVGVEHCVGVANGTDALELALRGLNADRKSKVGIVGNAGGYARTAIEQVGCMPVYLEIAESGCYLSLKSVQQKISNQEIDFLIITHLYGQAHPDILEISQICRAAKVPLIEDCAQAHGANVRGQKVGTFGAVATFSFYPTKNLGAIGDAGAITCHEAGLASRIRSLSQYGWRDKYEVHTPGGRNSRLDEIQAAVLRNLLPKLDSWNKQRRKIASIYQSNIVNPSLNLPEFNLDSYVGHLFPVYTSQPQDLIRHLNDFKVDSSIHYPIDDQEQFAWISSPRETSTKTVFMPVTIPISQYLEKTQVRKIIMAVNSYPGGLQK